jgi:hypothetical protein
MVDLIKLHFPELSGSTTIDLDNIEIQKKFFKPGQCTSFADAGTFHTDPFDISGLVTVEQPKGKGGIFMNKHLSPGDEGVKSIDGVKPRVNQLRLFLDKRGGNKHRVQSLTAQRGKRHYDDQNNKGFLRSFIGFGLNYS